MTGPVDIMNLIDAGLGNALSSGQGPIDQTYCVRVGCQRKPETGHDFCAPCLAWLRFETDDDPAAAPSQPPPLPEMPPVAPPEGFDDVEWAWLSGLGYGI